MCARSCTAVDAIVGCSGLSVQCLNEDEELGGWESTDDTLHWKFMDATESGEHEYTGNGPDPAAPHAPPLRAEVASCCAKNSQTRRVLLRSLDTCFATLFGRTLVARACSLSMTPPHTQG